MTNEEALERTLARLDEDDADAAQFEMLRTMARAVDQFPARATLLKEYREALYELRTRMDNADDSLEDALARLRSTAPSDAADSGT